MQLVRMAPGGVRSFGNALPGGVPDEESVTSDPQKGLNVLRVSLRAEGSSPTSDCHTHWLPRLAPSPASHLWLEGHHHLHPLS